MITTIINTILTLLGVISNDAFRSELTRFASFLRANVSFAGFQLHQCKVNMVKRGVLPALVGIERINRELRGNTAAKFDSMAQFCAYMSKIGNNELNIAKYALYFAMKGQFSEFGASGAGRLSLQYLNFTCGYSQNTAKTANNALWFDDEPVIAQKTAQVVENVQETQDIAEMVKIIVAQALALNGITSAPAGLTKVSVENAPKTAKKRDNSGLYGKSF